MIDWDDILVVDGSFDSLSVVNNDLTKDDNDFINIEIYKDIANDTKKARTYYTDGVRSVLTKDQIHLAESVADYITDSMKKAVSKSGGEFEGLDCRLKSEKSLSDKLRDRKSSGGDGVLSSRVLKEASEDIFDIVRFTIIFDPDEFVDNFFHFQDLMKQRDIKFVKIRNTFGATTTYKGLNTNMLALVDVDGETIEYIFEVQFHTKQSYSAKSRSHEHYKKERDKTLPQSERDAAIAAQEEIFLGVDSPRGWQLIKEIDVM